MGLRAIQSFLRTKVREKTGRLTSQAGKANSQISSLTQMSSTEHHMNSMQDGRCGVRVSVHDFTMVDSCPIFRTGDYICIDAP